MQLHPEHSPDHSIRTEGPVAVGGGATLHDRTGLYLAIIALVFAALCLGLFLMQTFLMPQIIDAKVQAGIARAEATANEARTSARVALDDVMRVKAQLEARGLYKPTDNH